MQYEFPILPNMLELNRKTKRKDANLKIKIPEELAEDLMKQYFRQPAKFKNIKIIYEE
jgi:hypothetical protein